MILSMLLLGCGASEAESGSAPPDDPAPAADHEEAADGPAPETEPSAEDPDRARVIAQAEAFVRAQGYADTPPTVSEDEIVHEGIEGTIEMRRNTLVPRAVRASRSGDGWMVVFRYTDPRYAERGRALMIRRGQTPRFEHQDLVLSPADDDAASDALCLPLVSGCGCAHACALGTRDLGEGRHEIARDPQDHRGEVAVVQRWCFDARGTGSPAEAAPAGATRCQDVFYDRTPCGGECIPDLRFLSCRFAEGRCAPSAGPASP